MKQPGVEKAYTVNYVASDVIDYQDFNDLKILAKDIENGYIVLCQHHGIFTGEILGGNLLWLREGLHEKEMHEHLVWMRVFNPVKEYYFWRIGNEIKGRLRVDGVEQQKESNGLTAFVDAEMVLRGVVADALIKKSSQKIDKKILHIETRNYIGYNEYGQAGYVDSRFVDIIKKA